MPLGTQTNRQTILVIEDEPAIAESLAYTLQKQEFDTLWAGDLRTANTLVDGCDLILLDLMLPDGSGLELLRRLRTTPSAAPVIVLSSRDSEEDRVRALESGADDYVTKPFSPREIVARVKAVLRRVPKNSSRRLGPRLSINKATHRATCAEQELALTRVEFDLLGELVLAGGNVLARSELINRVWGQDFAITDRTIDSHVKSLRRKITEAGGTAQLVETVRGVGYRISTSDVEPCSD